MIIPIEKRITTFSVLNSEIINDKQKQSYIEDFKADINEIVKKRIECSELMSDKNNLFSYVYVHKNGAIEKETNVSKPKYTFHLDYWREE